jgi:lambda repressor-like predicted transcriptional regulator
MIAEEKQVLIHANAEIRRTGRSTAHFAKAIGVSTCSLEQALAGERPFRVIEVIMLAHALGQRASEWLEEPQPPILIDRGQLGEYLGGGAR